MVGKSSVWLKGNIKCVDLTLDKRWGYPEMIVGDFKISISDITMPLLGTRKQLEFNPDRIPKDGSIESTVPKIEVQNAPSIRTFGSNWSEQVCDGWLH